MNITGKQLRDARKKLKLTAERVAKKVGVSANTIYAWESGTSTPRDAKVQKKLHDLLGLSVGTAKLAEARARRLRRTPKATKGVAASPDVAFFHLLAFFMKDPARLSTTRQFLIEARNHGLSLDNLIEMLDVTSPLPGL